VLVRRPIVGIPVPGLRQPVGAGDALKRALARAGVPACGDCDRRAQLMNRLAMFRPIRRRPPFQRR